MSTLHIFFFMSKGFFAVLKIIELWKTRYDEFIFINEEIEKKEKDYISNLKAKTYLELIVMLYVYGQIVALLIYGEGKPFYFTIVIIYFIIVLGYQGIIYYKQYENVNEYYCSLENSLKIIYIKNEEEEECIICTERIIKARQLSCNHFFHLICLSQWLEKGHNTCPVCRSTIKYKNHSGKNNKRENNNNNTNNNNQNDENSINNQNRSQNNVINNNKINN